MIAVLLNVADYRSLGDFPVRTAPAANSSAPTRPPLMQTLHFEDGE
jgi:hypothetical protein